MVEYPLARQEQDVEQAKITAEELMQLARDEVPIAGRMGIQVEEVEPGRVGACVPFQEAFVRPGGTIAGPWAR